MTCDRVASALHMPVTDSGPSSGPSNNPQLRLYVECDFQHIHTDDSHRRQVLGRVRLSCSKSALMGILGMKIRLSTHTHDNWTRGAGLNQDTISSLTEIIG